MKALVVCLVGALDSVSGAKAVQLNGLPVQPESS